MRAEAAMDKEALIRQAMDARKCSYAPYSHYNVGAALLCADGTIVKGANIENASYGATVCAERTAVFSAVVSGKRDLKAIAIVGGPSKDRDETSDLAFPCGICRQVLREFADPMTFIIIVARSEKDYREYTLEDLLPESFGPDNLE